MKKLAAIALLILPIAALAATPVSYEVSFDNAAHHEARITVIYVTSAGLPR